MSRTKRKINITSRILSEEEFNNYLNAFKNISEHYNDILKEKEILRKNYYKEYDKINYKRNFWFLSKEEEFSQKQKLLNNLSEDFNKVYQKYGTTQEEFTLCKQYFSWCKSALDYDTYKKKECARWKSDKNSGFWNCPKSYRKCLNRKFRAQSKNKLSNALYNDNFDNIIFDKSIRNANWNWF